MTEQETLPGTPDRGGMWSRFLEPGVLRHTAHINHAAWLRARAAGEAVGTCRRCGGDMMPEAPLEIQGRTDYEAGCVGEIKRLGDGEYGECGCIMVAPGGRVVRGTTTAWSGHNGGARAEELQRATREGM